MCTIYYIYIRGVAGRSVNGFIKSVFVVVTTAEKNYFFSPFFLAHALSLSIYLSLSTLSTPLSFSLSPFTLSPTTPRRRRPLPPSSSLRADRRTLTVYRRAEHNIVGGGVPRMCARGVRRADNWLFPDAHKLRSRTPFSVPAHIMPPANSLILHLPSSQTKLMTLIETTGPLDGMREPQYWHSSSVHTNVCVSVYIYTRAYIIYALCVYAARPPLLFRVIIPLPPPIPSGQLEIRPPPLAYDVHLYTSYIIIIFR